MANTYVQPGEVIEHAPASDVDSGAPTIIGSRVGVALVDAPSGVESSFAVVGVYRLPKTSGAIAQGAEVYLTSGGNISTTATDNSRAGYAWAAAASGDGDVLVKLDG